MIRRVPLFALFLGLAALVSCASKRAGSELTDFSLAVGKPYPTEFARAQTRVDRYLARLSPARRARLEGYLAVESTTMPVGQVPGLANRLGLGRGRLQAASAYGGDTENRMSGTAIFVMIFDARTGKPATDEGFVVIDTPHKGASGIFGGYTATYIGTG
jgi:hypothetical protein